MQTEHMIDEGTDDGQKSSDFSEWLQAMKMVAFLPDGTPPEFRRKLWLVLSEKYLHVKNINWEKEKEKCFCDTWHEDDEELGDQIIKDLHRTGSSLCSGPTGNINQAKLKKILIGYARWNPEVGYCQGFNMLGALILEVMDKEEIESMKVMLYLIEGIFPSGYFSGSLSGLQVDMAVFRELMLNRLPKLAQHLEKLQGQIEKRCFEPPLTNVFTMQWFLTMFCTCLPINCVLRIWDLVLIEGSGILLRSALAIWSILEDKILCSKSADDFYCKMGILSAEMFNGTLINSDELIKKVIEFGPINQLHQLRQKHLRLTLLKDGKKFKLQSFDDEDEADDESSFGATKTMGRRIITRRSSNTCTPIHRKSFKDNRDRIALDIPLLKKQYDRLRERQRQAHVILTAAVNRQTTTSIPSTSISVNKLLEGKNAIVTNKGRRIGPPQGAVPPFRKSENNLKNVGSLSNQAKESNISNFLDNQTNNLFSSKYDIEKFIPGDYTFPEIMTDIPKRSRKRSESSSFSEDSDNNSSTSTSLCDEEESDRTDYFESALEASQIRDINKYSAVELENVTLCSKISFQIQKDSENILEDFNIVQNVPLIDTNKAVHEKSFETDVISNSINVNSIEFDKKSENIVEFIKESNDNISTPKTKINSFVNSSSADHNCEHNSTLNIDSSYVDTNLNQPKLPTPENGIKFFVNEQGFTNKYFERLNNTKRLSNINFNQCESLGFADEESGQDILSIIDNHEKSQTNDVNIPETSINLISDDNISINEVYLILNGETCSKRLDNPLTFSPELSTDSTEIPEKCHSDLAVRIIEENSKVLHRILKKGFFEKNKTERTLSDQTFTADNCKSLYLKNNLKFLKDVSETQNESYEICQMDDYNIVKFDAIDNKYNNIDQNELETKTNVNMVVSPILYNSIEVEPLKNKFIKKSKVETDILKNFVEEQINNSLEIVENVISNNKLYESIPELSEPTSNYLSYAGYSLCNLLENINSKENINDKIISPNNSITNSIGTSYFEPSSISPNSLTTDTEQYLKIITLKSAENNPCNFSNKNPNETPNENTYLKYDSYDQSLFKEGYDIALNNELHKTNDECESLFYKTEFTTLKCKICNKESLDKGQNIALTNDLERRLPNIFEEIFLCQCEHIDIFRSRSSFNENTKNQHQNCNKQNKNSRSSSLDDSLSGLSNKLSFCTNNSFNIDTKNEEKIEPENDDFLRSSLSLPKCSNNALSSININDYGVGSIENDNHLQSSNNILRTGFNKDFNILTKITDQNKETISLQNCDKPFLFSLEFDDTNLLSNNKEIKNLELQKYNSLVISSDSELTNSNVKNNFELLQPEGNIENIMKDKDRFPTEKSINDRLLSIKNTIKSIDSLCEDNLADKNKLKDQIGLNDPKYSLISPSLKENVEELGKKKESFCYGHTSSDFFQRSKVEYNFYDEKCKKYAT